MVLDNLLKKQEIDQAETRLAQILDLYAEEYSKGVYDHDHGVMQNTGFIGDRPIHLDVGKLLSEEKMRNHKHAKEDAEIVVRNMNLWVKKHYPQYSERIASFLMAKLANLFDVQKS